MPLNTSLTNRPRNRASAPARADGRGGRCASDRGGECCRRARCVRRADGHAVLCDAGGSGRGGGKGPHPHRHRRRNARSIVFDISRRNVWPAPFTGRCLRNAHADRGFGREVELLRHQEEQATRYGPPATTAISTSPP